MIIVEKDGKRYAVVDKQLGFLIANATAHPDMLSEIPNELAGTTHEEAVRV